MNARALPVVVVALILFGVLSSTVLTSVAPPHDRAPQQGPPLADFESGVELGDGFDGLLTAPSPLPAEVGLEAPRCTWTSWRLMLDARPAFAPVAAHRGRGPPLG